MLLKILNENEAGTNILWRFKTLASVGNSPGAKSPSLLGLPLDATGEVGI